MKYRSLIGFAIAALSMSAYSQVSAVFTPFTGADSIQWGQFGGTYTNVANPATGMTTLGNSFTVSNASGNGQIRQQGNGWAGNFNNGDMLYWSNQGGPVTISGLNATSVGAFVDPDFYNNYGPMTLYAYDGATLLGSVLETTPTSGTPAFLGISSSSTITSVVYSLPAGSGTEDFAIDTVQINATPEPGSLLCLGAPVLGLLIKRRKK